jgi:hypothetical protein
MKNIIAIALTAFITLGPVNAAFAHDTGSFVGASDHITTGGVTVTKNYDGTATVVLDANFSLDGAPDPRVGFGKDGEFVALSDLGALQNLTGAQTYIVPASINVDDFNEVYIWCLKFGVPLGVAQIN